MRTGLGFFSFRFDGAVVFATTGLFYTLYKLVIVYVINGGEYVKHMCISLPLFTSRGTLLALHSLNNASTTISIGCNLCSPRSCPFEHGTLFCEGIRVHVWFRFDDTAAVHQL